MSYFYFHFLLDITFEDNILLSICTVDEDVNCYKGEHLMGIDNIMISSGEQNKTDESFKTMVSASNEESNVNDFAIIYSNSIAILLNGQDENSSCHNIAIPDITMADLDEEMNSIKSKHGHIVDNLVIYQGDQDEIEGMDKVSVQQEKETTDSTNILASEWQSISTLSILEIVMNDRRDYISYLDQHLNIRPDVPRLFMFHRVREECNVCQFNFSNMTLHCCYFQSCATCLKRYVEEKVSNGMTVIYCINTYCDNLFSNREILNMISFKSKTNYEILLQRKGKTCPQCGIIYKNIMEHQWLKRTAKVNCHNCSFEWCYSCQCPWHHGITCWNYKRQQIISLKEVVFEQANGEKNATICPQCKTLFQKSTGCNYMICAVCECSFCYLCGERIKELCFLGGHFDRLSIFGCKEKLFNSNPLLRKSIRFVFLIVRIFAMFILCILMLASTPVILLVYSCLLCKKFKLF